MALTWAPVDKKKLGRPKETWRRTVQKESPKYQFRTWNETTKVLFIKGRRKSSWSTSYFPRGNTRLIQVKSKEIDTYSLSVFSNKPINKLTTYWSRSICCPGSSDLLTVFVHTPALLRVTVMFKALYRGKITILVTFGHKDVRNEGWQCNLSFFFTFWWG